MRGGSSLFVPGNASFAANYVNSLNAIPGGLGTRDFCAEIWARWGIQTNMYSAPIHMGAGTDSQYSGIIMSYGGCFGGTGGGWSPFAQPAWDTQPQADVWSHCALVRRNMVWRLFYKGRKQGTDFVSVSGSYAVNPERIMVGCQATSGQWTGYIDSFRLALDDYVYWDDFDPGVWY
jgi:hypothetical protein